MKNRLTFFLDSGGHGFIGLECRNCAEDKPAEFKAGFYPRVTAKCNNVIRHAENRDRFLLDKLENLQSIIIPFVKSIAPLLVNQVAPGVSTAAKMFSITSPDHPYSILNEGDVDGKTICNATEGDIQFKRYSGYFEKDYARMHQVSYSISDEDSIEIFERVKHLAENNEVNYRYSLVGQNCLDFTYDIYQLTSLERKSFTGIYDLNPLASFAGFNGPAGAYMAGRDAYEAAWSANPIVVMGALYAAQRLCSWASNKLSRNFGAKFDPESITDVQRKAFLEAMKDARKKIRKSIRTLEKPLNIARELMNDCYGDTSRKDEYQELRNCFISLREYVKTCKDKLMELHQLNKDYDSLFTEYSSHRYANQILTKIREFPVIVSALKSKRLEVIAAASVLEQEKQSDTVIGTLLP